MRLRQIAAATVFLVALQGWDVPEAAAQGASVLRSQSRIIERAINRNIERAFRPRLVVREGATGPVTALALGGDESVLLTGVGNNTVRVWDLRVGREVARLSGHQGRILGIAISSDTRRAASIAEDNSVRLWNLAEIGEAGILEGHAGALSSVIFADDDRAVVAAGRDGELVVWDAATGAHRLSFRAGSAIVGLAPVDGGRVLVLNERGAVAVHSLADGARQSGFDTGAPARTFVYAGGRLAVGDSGGTVVVFDIASGARLVERRIVDGRVTALAYHPKSGRIAAADGNGKLRLFDPAADTVRDVGGHDRGVGFVALSRDGAFALSASEDGTTRLWSLSNPGNALLTLISTEQGWSVIDDKGRYDGNEVAVTGIDWQDDNTAVPIDNFAESHYEPSLLPRTLGSGPTFRDASRIADGVGYPPRVEIAAIGEPSDGGVVVEVMAEDRGGGVAEVRLYRNSRAIGGGALTGSRTERGGDGQMRVFNVFSVPLEPGDNTLRAVALNDDRLVSPQTSRVVTLPGQALPGTFHVVSIGINDYRHPDADLAYAQPDAQSLGSFFEGAVLPRTPPRVERLFDAVATKQAILDRIRAFRSGSVRDALVIYMAGHGVSDGDEWVFLPAGTWNAADPEATLKAGLTAAELKREIEALPVGQIFLLIDACQSGTAVSPLAEYQGMRALRLLAGGTGVHALAATDRSQGAVELEALGHGVFTYSLLQGLRGAADVSPADGRVSAREAIRYVEAQVPLLSRTHAEYDQFPTGYSRGADFVVADVPGTK